MSIFHPAIFYVHLPTLLRILRLNLWTHVSIRRALFTIGFVLLWAMGVVVLSIARILDEIFFPKYHEVDLSEPVFIVSNPRSGTTYLHRLLCLDQQRYNHTLLYHTIFPSVTILKLIQAIGAVDRRIGRPLRKLFDWLDTKFFGGWSDIHPMGFNHSEEDEAFFTLMVFTPALVLLSPWAYRMDYLNYLDRMDPAVREKMKAFYISSLKRFMFATDPDATLLMKNVFSTGRMDWLMDCFPKARIIYPVRSPLKAVPSVVSMFTGPWRVHSPEIADDSEECRGFARIATNYYDYFREKRATLDPRRFAYVKYDDLVAQPMETVSHIYDQLDLEMSDDFREALRDQTRQTRSYKSRHSYSLEQYGLSPEDITEPLAELFDEFDFPKTPQS